MRADKMISEDKLIISLIKDNLINTRLVHGLEKLGFDAGNYHVHLSETIFKLIGIDDDCDELFEEYLEMCEGITEIDIFKYPGILDSAAQVIYKKLQKEKNRL